MAHGRVVLVGLISCAFLTVGLTPTASGAADTHESTGTAAHATGAEANPPGPGYWVVSRAGDVFPSGAAGLHGSTGAIALHEPIVGLAATPSGNGYWLVARDGGIFAFGDAAFHGSAGAIILNEPIVGIASTRSGRGYWLVAADGGIFAFGDAAFFGSTGAITLNQPIVGIASTPTGRGYLLVASDGGIFAFGDAAFHGSTGATALNMPIVGIASTPTGHGYWMVARDGGIFSFGDAGFFGSTGATALNMPIVGMAAGPTGNGYWFVAADGGIFSFGDAHFFGAARPRGLAPIVGLAASAPNIAQVVDPAAASLGIRVRPSGSTGGVMFETQPVVIVRDGAGHPFVQSTAAVTLSITSPPIGVSLRCDNNTVHAVAGVATFSGCSINRAGTYTLRARSGRLSPTSTSVAITVGPAARIAFVQQPSGSASLAPFGTQPHVATEDAGGNIITTNNTGSATLSLQTPVTPVDAVLACAGLTAPYVNGVASFTDCNIDRSGTYNVHGDDGTFTADSNSVGITAAGSSKVVFSNQPSSANGGVAFSSQPVIEIQDTVGNVVTADTSSVVLTLTTANGATLACADNPQTAVAGVATFSGCSIDIASDTPYTLHAADAGLTPATSGPITITAGAATTVAFVQQPSSSTGGVAFTTQPHVAIQDAVGNTVTGDTSVVTLSLIDPAGATLTCTSANSVPAVTGVADFSGCNIDLANDYTLHADDGLLTGADSTTVTITVGAATKLGFVQQPSSSTGGVAFTTQPHVAIQDAGGNTVAGNATAVTLSLTNAAGATLTCSSANPLPPVVGVAGFTGCRINLANATPYTLHAIGSGLTAADSGPVTISVGVPAALAFTTQPGNATGGVAFTPQPAVTVRDAGGNTVTGDTSTVALTLTTAAGAVLTCTPRAAVAGVATFAGCSINLANNYTLHADDGGLPFATSATVTISVGPAVKLGFVQQPSATQSGGIAFATQPHVAVQDAGGNTVTTDTRSVTLTLTTAAGAFFICTNASPLETINGVASFTGCSIDRASATPYTLHAAVTGLTAATSSPIRITIGPAFQIAFTIQPSASSAANANFVVQPQVKIEDAGGNVLTGNNTSSISLDLTRPSTPGGAVLSCAATTMVVTAGVATFTGCSVDTASAPDYSLDADDTTDALIGTSSSFVITP